MLHANQETPSKLRTTIACCVLTSTICAQAASADTIFFDNFNDGNAGDGMPVTWVPGSGNVECLQRRLRCHRFGT